MQQLGNECRRAAVTRSSELSASFRGNPSNFVKPLGDHLETTWRPIGDHFETTSRPLGDHFPFSWKQFNFVNDFSLLYSFKFVLKGPWRVYQLVITLITIVSLLVWIPDSGIHFLQKGPKQSILLPV